MTEAILEKYPALEADLRVGKDVALEVFETKLKQVLMYEVYDVGTGKLSVFLKRPDGSQLDRPRFLSVGAVLKELRGKRFDIK